MYLPESAEANGGQKLVRKADFHVGQHINTMFRIRAKITDPSAGSRYDLEYKLVKIDRPEQGGVKIDRPEQGGCKGGPWPFQFYGQRKQVHF